MDKEYTHKYCDKIRQLRSPNPVSVEDLYKFLRSIDGCNTEWIDSEWADNVDLKRLAQALHDRIYKDKPKEPIKTERIEEFDKKVDNGLWHTKVENKLNEIIDYINAQI